MGSGQSNLGILSVDQSKLQLDHQISRGNYVQPYRQFNSEYHKKSQGRMHESAISIVMPEKEQISLTQTKFKEIEEAYEEKTKNFEIQAVIFDQFYTDRVMYTVRDLDSEKSILLRSFSNYDSQIFGNVACEVFINQEVSNLQCKNLLEMTDNYLVQSGPIKIDPKNTQVMEFDGVSASLAQIIEYRRGKKWEWVQNQFNQLAYDLSSAVKCLHENGICHNDIRPQNVFYHPIHKAYVLGQFGYATKGAEKGNMSTNRAFAEYSSTEAKNNQEYELKKADVFATGVTLLSAFFLKNPIDVKNAQILAKKFSSITGVKIALEMLKPQSLEISVIAGALKSPEYNFGLMKNMIESLRFKTLPKNKNPKIYKRFESELYKRLGLWNYWRDEVNSVLEQSHGSNRFETAQLYNELALIDFCEDDLQEATMNSKKASRLYREMGQDSFREGDYNQALKHYSSAVNCSKFFVNSHDLDLAKSLIGLSKVHAEKRQKGLAQTLLFQSKQLVAKESSEDSILYAEMGIKEAQLKRKFNLYQESIDCLRDAEVTACKMEGINEKASRLCQGKIFTLKALNQISLARQCGGEEKRQHMLDKVEFNLNRSKQLYQSIPEADCHLELAENTEVLGELYIEKNSYSDAELCFEKALAMRRHYQEEHKQAPYIVAHGQALTKIGTCKRLKEIREGSEGFEGSLESFQQALHIFRMIYGSDHNAYSAQTLKEMGLTYRQMEEDEKADDCEFCSKQIMQELFGKSAESINKEPQRQMRRQEEF